MRSRLSLRQRMFVLTAFAVVPAFAIVGINEATMRETREAEVNAYVTRMSAVTALEVERALIAVVTLMIAMSETRAVTEADPAYCASYAAAVREEVEAIYDVVVADAEGSEICHQGGLAPDGRTRLLADFAPRLAEARFAVGRYTATPTGPALPIAMALREGEGPAFGYLIVAIGLSALENYIFDGGFGPGSTVTVTDAEGTIIVQVPPHGSLVGTPLPPDLDRLVRAPEPGTIWTTGINGIEQALGYRPLTERIPLATLVGMPARQIMAPINNATMRALLIALAGAMLAMTLTWVAGDAFIRRPIARIVGTMTAWRAGDADARTGVRDSQTELRALASALDELFDELNRRQEAQLQAGRQRDVLAREMQHRIKNLLAVVQAIASQTLGGDAQPPQVRDFEERVGVLIRSHLGLLSGEPDATALAGVLDATAGLFSGTGRGRLSHSGPPVTLGPKATLALSMALHELGTNAVKHGALSRPEGRVQVTWEIEDDCFTLRWTERGGPPVVPSQRSGFGTVLITRMVEAETRGKVTLDFRPEGLVFELRAPLEEIARDAARLEPARA